jgi:NADPH:quinone reductase-like Zn-dependent oxidoreductase
MIQVQITGFGGPDKLKPVERPSPPIQPGCVRISVSAAGVNFAEAQMRMGLYPEAPKVPFVPGFELAGVVSEVAPGVTSFRKGERVLAACRFGGYTTEIVLPAFQVRPTPRRLSDREAASIPIAFATAWIALVEMARVREGDRVLVPGAAGGVGNAMIQLAAQAGAQVVAVVGNHDKKDLVRSLGATRAITYAELETAGKDNGFTIILDARGGTSIKNSMKLLTPAGRIVSYGVSDMVTGLRRSIPRVLLQLLKTPLLTPIGLAMANQGIHGMNLLKLFDTQAGTDLLMRAVDGALDGFATGIYKATVGKTFPLEKAGDAHAYLQSRKGSGKVILTC